MKPTIISALSLLSLILSLSAIVLTRRFARISEEQIEENVKLRALLYRAGFIVPLKYEHWHDDARKALHPPVDQESGK